MSDVDNSVMAALDGSQTGPVLPDQLVNPPQINQPTVLPTQQTASQIPLSSPVTPIVAQPVNSEAQSIAAQEGEVKNQMSAIGQADKISNDAFNQYDQASKAVETPDQVYAKYSKADADLAKAYADKSIDPNQYLHNMGTPSKILAGIGLLLSGAGSGKTGQPNLALQQINRAVDQDIEAQKNNQSKQFTLYKMNHEHMEDETKAHMATQNQLWSGVQAKLAQAAQITGSADAKARAQQAWQQLQMQKDQNNQKMALLSGGQNGQTQNIDPVQAVPFLVPAEHQTQAITEIGQAQAAIKNADSIKNIFDQAAKDTRPATGMSGTSIMNTIPGYTAPSIKALKMLFDPIIHNENGRVTELEQQHVQANFPQWGDSNETVQKKWAALSNFINDKKLAPTAKAYGIDIGKYGSTSDNPAARMSQQDQTYYAWAKKNPNSPIAQAFLQKHGLK